MPRPLHPLLLTSVLAALAAAGCGEARPTNEGPAVPPEATARAGLVEALKNWRDERPAPKDAPPKVGLVDSDHISHRHLIGFEVLGPIDLGVGRGFTVRLSLAPEDGTRPDEQIARYVVFGIDPLWVFRLEDYERISHWEHKMDPETDDPGA